jgi:tellurite methyltransferase
MLVRVLPRLRFLDPRPALQAMNLPIESAVNIPLTDLGERMHELPPRHEDVLVAGEAEAVAGAVAFLLERERKAVAAGDWQFGPATPGRLWEPNSFLLEHLPKLSPGHALDLACGTGRDAVAMAAYGWSVLAVDHLEDALQKGRDLASRYLPAEESARVDWRAMDLESESPDGAFDLVTMFYYLDRPLLLRMSEQLSPGGHLMVETFTSVHREEHGKPRREHLVLAPGELPEILSELKLVHYDEGWREDRHTARGLFSR